MIKTFEQYKNKDKNLINFLWEKIIKDKKEINGFNVNADFGSGAIEWHGEDYGIFATPYWEYCDDLPIETFDQDGETFEELTIELEPIENLNDVDDFLIKYYDIIYNVTKKLNKRSEIVEVLTKIYDDLPLSIKNQIEYKSEQFTNVKTDNLIQIYSIIEEKYPELITAHKYNL